MLDQSTVSKKEKLIETNQARMDELSKSFDDTRKEIAECKEKIKNFNISIEDEGRKIRELDNILVQIKSEHTPLLDEVSLEKEALKQDAFDKKVKGYVDEYTGFYEALEARLCRLQNEYKETMSQLFRFVEPQIVIKTIRKMIENNNFSQTAIEYRQAKSRYEQSILEICTVKANGGKPSFHAAKSISSQLDLFLESGGVIDVWHTRL